ncbi:MAG TPA: M36 family metallopeptidase, partial [Saprospiraceae bacterium]|nr:M36 family metallopeptidase [Saprospiraceae bacterium]
MKASFTRIPLFVLCLLAGTAALAQQQTPLDIALRYLEQHREQWQLTETDVKDVVVSDQYVTRHNGVTHLYFIQRHAGIELYNAINGVHITQDGKVGYATNRFSPALANRVNTTTPSLTPYQAIEAAANHLQLPMNGLPRLLEQVSDKQFVYDGGNLSHSNIKVKLVYQLVEGGMARLAWDLAIDMPNSADYWSLRVDAITGEILDQNNWTVYCNFDASHDHEQDCGIAERQSPSFRPVQEALEMESRSVLNDNAQYNVFAFPAESPKHGDRGLLVNPADPVASPYGWHDTNGQDGPEYRITRGNNVHAYLDLDDDNIPAGDEPNGGDNLIFDFPLDLTLNPSDYREAAVTQLFYVNNFMHDFTYAYGFDEQAGNFQQNNYGNGGAGGDYVLAQSQDGGGTNNANFGTPPDGSSGTMQMYLFNAGGSIFKVNSPQSVAGGYEVEAAGFGALIGATPVTGPIVVVNDGSSEASLGCNASINTDQLQGAIAMIDRGSCEFGLKALNAQNAGAIGAIICNFEDALVNMGAGTVGGSVTIPV